MDTLIHQATELANQPTTPVTPIEGRIAYVVSHGASYGSNGYAVRTQGVAQALNGHGFETLCFVRPGRPWELGASKGSTRPEVTVKGVRYIHSRWPNDRSPISESEHLAESVERFIELFRVYRPAVVMAASNYIVGLPAWVAAKRLGLPFYNEVRGFWELSRAAREPGFEKTELFSVEAELDTFVAKQALKVFTLNEPMRGELVERGVNRTNVHLVPNALTELTRPEVPSFTLRKKHDLSTNVKVIGYIGSTNAYEGLDDLETACEKLISEGHDLKLLVVGDQSALLKAAGKKGDLIKKPWIVSTGRVAPEEVPAYYALADLIAIPRKPYRVCQLVPPMKVVEAIGYQKPVVVSDVVPLQPYASRYQQVVSFAAGSSAELAKAIRLGLETPVPVNITTDVFNNAVQELVQVLTGKSVRSNAQPEPTLPNTSRLDDTGQLKKPSAPSCRQRIQFGTESR
ncbi:glycosyltransferase [Marinobacterium aestuariivivens]|uniref:Glycosyltransferase n=1 Tax=Marinobacterium aestuariivivens TaxID=1698799 RepID=A0ABW1ZUQ4_9GAMM